MTTHLVTAAALALMLMACTNGQMDPRTSRALNAIGTMLVGQELRKSQPTSIEPVREQQFCKPMAGGYIYCW